MSNISYSAVVLDSESANRLKSEFSKFVPDGYEWIGHHMTINMGELKPDMKQHLGKKVDLVVNALGADERVVAVGIGDGGDLSNNKLPHITIGVNRAGGGKPVHSSEIKNWKPVSNRLRLTGTIEEIPR